MFTILTVRKLGLDYFAILYGHHLVHTCMSEAGARTWVKKREQAIQRLTR